MDKIEKRKHKLILKNCHLRNDFGRDFLIDKFTYVQIYIEVNCFTAVQKNQWQMFFLNLPNKFYHCTVQPSLHQQTYRCCRGLLRAVLIVIVKLAALGRRRQGDGRQNVVGILKPGAEPVSRHCCRRLHYSKGHF